MISRNFSHGYGPQEYLTRFAQSGIYQVNVKLFSSMAKYTGTTILVWIWTHYGNPKKEGKKLHVFRMTKDREERHVANIVFA